MGFNFLVTNAILAKILKGTVSIISVTLHAKMAILDSQRYP